MPPKIATIHSHGKAFKAQIFEHSPDEFCYEIWAIRGENYRPLLRDLRFYKTFIETKRLAEELLEKLERPVDREFARTLPVLSAF